MTMQDPDVDGTISTAIGFGDVIVNGPVLTPAALT
jgi:hypothetical protein